MAETVAIIRKDARNLGYCIDPVFGEDAITIRPVPRAMADTVREGEIWQGRLGIVRHFGSRDRNGKKILIQFFIPQRRSCINHALKTSFSGYRNNRP